MHLLAFLLFQLFVCLCQFLCLCVFWWYLMRLCMWIMFVKGDIYVFVLLYKIVLFVIFHYVSVLFTHNYSCVLRLNNINICVCDKLQLIDCEYHVLYYFFVCDKTCLSVDSFGDLLHVNQCDFFCYSICVCVCMFLFF